MTLILRSLEAKYWAWWRDGWPSLCEMMSVRSKSVRFITLSCMLWIKIKAGENGSNCTSLHILIGRKRPEDVSGCWVMNITSWCSMIWQTGHDMGNIYKSSYLVMAGAEKVMNPISIRTECDKHWMHWSHLHIARFGNPSRLGENHAPIILCTTSNWLGRWGDFS